MSKEEYTTGRPTKMTQETITKLEDAFSNGASDIEASFIADISTTTLYNYIKENPDFLHRKEALKDMIKYQARKNIAVGIKEAKDQALSQWYLERKVKDEFAQRTEQTGKDGAPLIESTEELKKLADKLNELKREQ